MTVNLSQAATAYARAATQAIDPGAAAATANGESFGDIMAQALVSASPGGDGPPGADRRG